MSNLKNVLNLVESKDGNRIKQGDKSIMQYALSDADNDELNLNGKEAIVYLSDRKGVRYKYDTTVQDNTVDVVIRAILPRGIYTLEIVVDDKYIFPSDNKSKLEITESVVGRALTKVENVDMLNDIISGTLHSDKFIEAVQDEAKKIVAFDEYKEAISNELKELKDKSDDMQTSLLKVASAKDIKITGSNLIEGSANFTYPFNHDRIAQFGKVIDNQLWSLDIQNGEKMWATQQDVEVEANTNYTLSFDAFSKNETGRAYVPILKLKAKGLKVVPDTIVNSSNMYKDVNKTIERKQLVFNSGDANWIQICFVSDDANNPVYISRPKLEKGTHATVYSE